MNVIIFRILPEFFNVFFFSYRNIAFSLAVLFILAFLFLLPESLHTAESLCQNVTFAEHYTFIWKDKSIERINVTVFLGSLCDGGMMKFLLRFFNLLFFLQHGNSVIESLIY